MIVVFSLIAGSLHTIIGLFGYYTFDYPDFFFDCAVGFSGVIFALLVVNIYIQNSSNEDRSIFGFFTLKAQLYPWVLLILLQLLIPGRVSFIGHLCGILVGYGYSFGYIHGGLIAPNSVINWIESSRAMSYFIQMDGYISNPGYSLANNVVRGNSSSAAPSLTSYLPTVMARPQSPPVPFSGQGHVLGTSSSNS